MDQSTLRFDKKVAIVTGAGAGLGKAYALFLSSRGAKVVVNDLGGSIKGEGANTRAADLVVDEIKKNGGRAVANYDSVEFGEKIVKTALDNFGTVDIVINNAGILRDVSFQKMSEPDWDLVLKVHLKGTYSVTKAAWNIMRHKQYGRIVNTSSSSGLYGSFGQANYAAAKMAVVGLASTLAKEGETKNIKINTVCPGAGTRMTDTVTGMNINEVLKTDYVAKFVALLCHEQCPENGSLFEVGGTFVSKVRYQRAGGLSLNPKHWDPENILKNWSKVIDFSGDGVVYPDNNMSFLKQAIESVNTPETEPVQVIQKLEAIPKIKEQVQSGVPVSLKSDDIFSMMGVFLQKGEGKNLIPKVQAIFGFEIAKVKGGKIEAIYEIDLKNGQGSCRKAKPATADATFQMTDDDFEAVCLGNLSPQMAFIQGKMKIKGNMSKANKFTPDLFPPPTPENLNKYKNAKL